MNWNDLVVFGMIAVWILIVGGVILLFPLSRRLGHLLEAMAKERGARPDPALERVREAVKDLERRVASMEERQEFTERLLSGSQDRAEVIEKVGAREEAGEPS